MKSMTGFGKSSVSNTDFQLDIEIKSVNQRFLDLQVRLPKECNPFEIKIRNLVQKAVARGRVEIWVTLKWLAMETKEVLVHWELLKDLQTKIAGQTQFSLDTAALIQQLMVRPDFIEVAERPLADSAELEQALDCGMRQALERLVAMRSQEGAGLQQLFQQYLTDFKAEVAQVSQLSHEIEADYKTRLTNKIAELTAGQFDEARILTEVTLMLEKGDIHEELDRLALHIVEAEKLLRSVAPVGRPFDFLLQEMNREVNTIGSKSSNIAIKKSVIQMKTSLEKIREQIQNIE